jgi:sugar/nucleoside kinase (ribokinase family)
VSAVAVVGNLSRDIVAGAASRPGGAVYYAARALSRIGAAGHIVTRCAAADTEDLLPQLESFGIPVTLRASARTTAFTFHYDGDHRVMHVDEIGDPWTVEDATGWVAEAIGEAEWVQIGALLRTDFPAAALAVLAGGGCSSTPRVSSASPASAHSSATPTSMPRHSVRLPSSS